LDDAPRLDADRRLLDLDPVDRLVCRLDCTLLRLIDVRDAGLGLDLALQVLQGIKTLVAQIVGCLRGIELRLDPRDVGVDPLADRVPALGDQGGVDALHGLDQRLGILDQA